jgi:hypothetical protein
MKNIQTFDQFLNESYKGKSDFDLTEVSYDDGTEEAIMAALGVSKPTDVLVANSDGEEDHEISAYVKVEKAFNARAAVENEDDDGNIFMLDQKNGIIKHEDYGMTVYFWKK